MRILVVDDSISIRKLIIYGLRKLPFEVEFKEAQNAKIAWDMLQEDRKFDLILTDWNMPVMTGIELVEKIRQSDLDIKNITIFMITSQRAKSKVLQAIKVGVNDYIFKPFKPSILIEKIKALYN